MRVRVDCFLFNVVAFSATSARERPNFQQSTLPQCIIKFSINLLQLGAMDQVGTNHNEMAMAGFYHFVIQMKYKHSINFM